MTALSRRGLLRERASIWVAAFWWGSLSTIGFLVVPLLFVYLPTPALAGSMAAKLFTAQSWVALICGLLLLLGSRAEQTPAGSGARAQASIIFIMAGMLLALLAELAVAPRIVARENLALWHRVGSAMYLLQWLCAGAVFWKADKSPDLRAG